MHSSNGCAIPLQDTRARIWVDAEIADGFIRIVCALDRAEGSFHLNIAVSISYTTVVGDSVDDKHERSNSQNTEHDNAGHEHQNDFERAVSLRRRRGECGRWNSSGHGYGSAALRAEFCAGFHSCAARIEESHRSPRPLNPRQEAVPRAEYIPNLHWKCRLASGPETRGVVGHAEREQKEQPENRGDNHNLGQFFTGVFDVHEE